MKNTLKITIKNEKTGTVTVRYAGITDSRTSGQAVGFVFDAFEDRTPTGELSDVYTIRVEYRDDQETP